MDSVDQISPPNWNAVLQTARHKQAQHLREEIRCLLRNPTGLAPLPALARRIALVSASLFCMTFAFDPGRHIGIIMAAIALASLVSSIAGFAFSAIGGAMLFHLSDDPVQVVQVMVTCSIANQVVMTWAGRRDIVWRELAVYLAGGAIGLSGGVWILLSTNHARYAPVLGVFLLGYGSYMFLRKPVVIRRQHPLLDFVVGLLGGITGGAAGFPGAFVTIWCSMKGWDKARQRAIFQPFILIMQVLTLLAIHFAQRHGGGFDMGSLLFIPPSLLGTSVGLSLYRRLSDTQFTRAINLLLIVSGVSYVV